MIDYLKSWIFTKETKETITLKNEGSTIIVSSDGSSGIDLKPSCFTVIPPFSSVKIGHQLYIEEMPVTYTGMIVGRSGINLEGKLIVRTGIIDSDYRGEISTILTNETNQEITLSSDMRISQLVFVKCFPAASITCSNMVVRDRVRGTNGFGSSGR
jgi:dUTP pyrophosphatase